MKINWKIGTRKVHYWGAALIAAPVVVVIGSGLLLQWKKHVAWIQPRTHRGTPGAPLISFEGIFDLVHRIPEADVRTWQDVARLDVQPDRGIIKIHARNHWEVQVDQAAGAILQVAYRRSDLIESIHDGSFFHPSAKLWLFFPVGLGLLLLWGTGIYLFLLPIWPRKKGPHRRAAPRAEIVPREGMRNAVEQRTP